MTVEQAAERVGRSVRTVNRWIAQGRLTAITHPLLEHRWVELDELLDVERNARRANRTGRFTEDRQPGRVRSAG